MVVDCGSYCPVPGGFYEYRPNVGGNVVLLVGFLLLIPCTLWLGFRSRTTFLTVSLVIGLLFDALGYLGRILLHYKLDSPGLFLLSLLGTILGPSFVTAAIFIVLPHVLVIYGEDFSPFRPTITELILCTLTAIGIGIEVVGVVFVTFTFNGVTRTHGGSIIAAGLGLQAAALFGGAAIYFCFILNFSSGLVIPENEHTAAYTQPRFGWFLRGLEVSATLLFAYFIYRIVEMTAGIDGGLFQSETGFMVMNGAIPLVSYILLTSFHPGTAFGDSWQSTSARKRKRPVPLPLQQEYSMTYSPHHAYNPNIGRQRPPRTIEAQQATSNYSVELQPGPLGLPSNPRPEPFSRSPTKPISRSPKNPSPRSMTSSNRRSSHRSERLFSPRQEMVDSEALW